MIRIILILLLVIAGISLVLGHFLFAGIFGLLWCIFIALRQDTVGLLRRVFFLLFNRPGLVNLANQYRPAELPRTFERVAERIQHNLWRAFWISFWCAVLSLSIFGVFYSYEVPHEYLIGCRFLAYCLILWGLFSPTPGRHIQIGEGGETLFEVVDQEWHRSIYMLGLVLLLLSYLFELKFKSVDTGEIDFSIFITTFGYLKSQPFSKYFFGYGISVVVGHIFINPINQWMRSERNRRQPGRKKKDRGGLLSELVGITERVAYTTALIAGYPQFVGLWLTLKFAGRWKEWQPEKPGGWGRVNIFLVGNILSILFSFAGAVIIRPNLFLKLTQS